MPFIHYESCPACGGAEISPTLTAKDYTVSGTNFSIWQCAVCSLRFTQDVPDEQSIGAYYKSENYISHTDTNKGLINSIYHQVRRRTLVNKHRLVSHFTGLEKGKLLDIGAGTGAFAAHMRDKDWEVLGIEPDEETRNKAFDLHQIKLEGQEALWQIHEDAVDAVTMWHVLEHVHNLHGYLKQIRNVLHSKGVAFIAVPNYTSFDASYYKSYWAAYDVPRHLYHFSPTAFKMLLQKHAFIFRGVEPMWYDSFYVSMLSELYKTGSNQLPSAFYVGARSNLITLRNKEKCSSLIYIFEKG